MLSGQDCTPAAYLVNYQTDVPIGRFVLLSTSNASCADARGCLVPLFVDVGSTRLTQS